MNDASSSSRKAVSIPMLAVSALSSLLVVAGIGFLGVRSGVISYAAQSVNPYGSFDYCTVENNATVIFGWAADPNATTLPQPNVSIRINDTSHLQPTSLAPYRETQINNYITSNYPRDPKPGSYGFKLAVSGLHKGSRNTISGTILNVGSGSNVPLPVNTSGKLDGVPANTFAGGVIPEACLVAAPAPPAPAPKPAPAPAPVRPLPAPAPSSPLSGEANATVTTGTFSAELQVPAGNAETITVKYGADPATLGQETAPQNITADPLPVLLTGLEAATTYSYQIIRTRAGISAASPVATLTTAGIVAQLSVIGADGQPAKDIQGTIDPTAATATTNDLGVMQFPNLTAGKYTVTIKYQGKTHKQQIILDGKPIPATESGNQPVTREFVINLASALRAPVEEKQSRSSLLPLIILGFVVLVTIAALLFRKRRSGGKRPARTASPATPIGRQITPAQPIAVPPQAVTGSSFSPVQAPEPIVMPSGTVQPAAPVTPPVPPTMPLTPPVQPAAPAPAAQPVLQVPPTPAPLPIAVAPPVAAPPLPPVVPQSVQQVSEPLILAERPDIPRTGRSLKEMVLEAMAEEKRRKNGPPGPQ